MEPMIAAAILRIEVQPLSFLPEKKQGNRKHKPPPRNENLGRIHRIGKKRWKEESHYHRRDLAEATMFRFQTILGGQLRCRHIDNSTALNWMSHLGMPDSYLVES